MRRFQCRNLPFALAIAIGVAGASLSLAPSIALAQTTGKPVTTSSGLQIIDTVVGTGDSPKPTQSVVVNYTGKLASNGKVFDSTTGRSPATFPLNQVIKGFSEGISTMKPGGKRTILIPAALAYGAASPPGSGIPPNSDLIFDIELISIK